MSYIFGLLWVCLVSMSRTTIVVSQLFYRMVIGQSFSWAAIFKFLTQVSLGAYVSLVFLLQCWQNYSGYMTLCWSRVGIGLAFGIVSVLWLGFIFNDTVIEITLTLAVSYIAYFTVRSLLSLGTSFSKFMYIYYIWIFDWCIQHVKVGEICQKNIIPTCLLVYFYITCVPLPNT